jgi:hypothetical protein
MNKRFRELADQCRFERQGINCEVLGQGFDEEKFAELIVRECMSVADFPKNLTGQWDHLESSEVIAAHFGLDK